MRDLKIPIFSILLAGLMASLFLPLMPIDETRYVSVAWEMRNASSFFLPLLNGEPYTHKPPLLFWLIQIVWKLLGVHDATPRLISVCFSILCIPVLQRISLLLWPDEKKTATLTALVLGSTVIWMLWSFAVMFDIILTFWTLLAVAGILLAENTNMLKKSWVFLTLGIAGGLLTKGPIILVYTLPQIIFHSFWSAERPFRWKLHISTALLTGFGLALLWAIPAAIQGGKNYSQAVFWDQTAGRISSSFAHGRPFGWYIPFLPFVFFPWILFKPSFSKLCFRPTEKGTRLVALWLVAPLIILSMISGKQIHYLIPLIPAGALLIGKNIALTSSCSGRAHAQTIGCVYVLIGFVALILPFIKFGNDIGQLAPGATLFSAIGFFAAGLILLTAPFRSVYEAARGVALSTLLALMLTLFKANSTFAENYDIKAISKIIKNIMDAGCVVAHVGKYHGQYQFIGRLQKPLIVLSKDTSASRNFIVGNPDGVLISYIKEKEISDNAAVLYKHRFRGKTAVLWRYKPEEPGL